MRLLWAARIVLPADGFAQAIEILEAWLRAPEREPSLEGPLRQGDTVLASGGQLQIDQSPEEGDPVVWAMRYERPVPVQGVTWITEVTLERRDPDLRASARLYQTSLAAGRPRLDRIVVRPPGFIWQFRSRGLMGAGAFDVQTVSVADVGRFVESVFDQQRLHLLVAISDDPYAERPLVNPRPLQDELVGIAQIAHIRKPASLALPAAFLQAGVMPGREKVWGVYGGAVKVYRTNVRPPETPFDHPIWMPSDVSESDFAATLKDWCWSLATLETRDDVPDVASIREARRSPQPPVPTPGLSLEDLTELYEASLAEEQSRAAEQQRRAETEKTRADELADLVRTLEAKIQALQYQLDRKYEAERAEAAEAPEPDIATAEAAVERARRDFATTLLIPKNVAISTSLNGQFWHLVLTALDRLCRLERGGHARNKREQLRDLLSELVGVTKDTYKVADTGVHINNPETGERVQMRERVHLREGRPAETESIYWQTIGANQTSFRYLIGRLGRHA
jgi:hypothetical protein